MKYTDIWNKLTERIGYWVDMGEPYITYKSKYMESVWWLIKQIHEKGFLYKGYSIQPFSPMAGTGLSSHELNQPGTYQETTDTTITAQFKTIPESLPEEIKDETKLLTLSFSRGPNKILYEVPSFSIVLLNLISSLLIIFFASS